MLLNSFRFGPPGSAPPVAPDLSEAIGFQPAVSSGTTGNLFVAKTGLDANAGTLASPKLTIGAAVAAATTGQEIKVRAGTYAETLDISAKALTVSRYGTERVIITGASPLPGAVPCVSADQAEAGPNWAQMYKVTVATSSIASGDPRAANLFENGVSLNYAMAWAPLPRFPRLLTSTGQWNKCDEILLQANPAPTAGRENHIIGYKLPSLTDTLTSAQILRGYVLFHGFPNVNGQSPITAFNTTTKAISFDGVGVGAYQASSTDKYRLFFALGNILPKMEKGGWGFVISGANTTFYIWPTNSANIAANISYSTRGKGVEIGTNCELRGLEFGYQASGGASADNLYSINAGGPAKRTNMRIKNCRTFDTWRGGSDDGYGAIWIGNADDLAIDNVTIDDPVGAFGIFIQGNSGVGDLGKRLRVRSLKINRAEKSPARFYGQQQAFISNVWVVQPSGLGAHANKSNFYEQNDRVIYHNCYFGGASGYLTWQEASKIAVVGCYVPTSYSGTDFRAIVDQNNSTATPARTALASGASFILRNTTVPYYVDPNATLGLSLGTVANPEVTYTVAANALVGHNNEGPAYVPVIRNNHMTVGPAQDVTDTISTNAATYVEHMIGDFAYRGNAPIRSAALANINPEITIIKSWVPDVTALEFDKDIYGNTVDWTSVKPGITNDFDAVFGMPPVLIDPPEISGAPALDSIIGTTPFFIVASPYKAISSQWQNSVDGITWSDIAGASSPTYTLTAADVGKYIGRNFYGAGIQFRGRSVGLVASSYALGTPISMALRTRTSATDTALADETTVFTSTGKALLVIVSQKAAASAENLPTVTAGAAGRAFGTGAALTLGGFVRRTTNQTHVFRLAPPAAGPLTIQVQGASLINSVRIQVFEVQGLTGFGVVTTTGATGVTSRVSTITTTTANSAALFILNRFEGNLTTNPITVDGTGTEFVGNTGGTTTADDLAISFVYERTPTAGIRTKTFSWPVARTAATMNMEMLS